MRRGQAETPISNPLSVDVSHAASSTGTQLVRVGAERSAVSVRIPGLGVTKVEAQLFGSSLFSSCPLGNFNNG